MGAFDQSNYKVIFRCTWCKEEGIGEVARDLHDITLTTMFRPKPPDGWRDLDGKPWCGQCDVRRKNNCRASSKSVYELVDIKNVRQ